MSARRYVVTAHSGQVNRAPFVAVFDHEPTLEELTTALEARQAESSPPWASPYPERVAATLEASFKVWEVEGGLAAAVLARAFDHLELRTERVAVVELYHEGLTVSLQLHRGPA